jgi:hypothetical protein
MACDVTDMANIMIEKEEFLEKIIWDWRMIILIEWVPNALKTVELWEWQKNLIHDASIKFTLTRIASINGFCGKSRRQGFSRYG